MEKGTREGDAAGDTEKKTEVKGERRGAREKGIMRRCEERPAKGKEQ